MKILGVILCLPFCLFLLAIVVSAFVGLLQNGLTAEEWALVFVGGIFGSFVLGLDILAHDDLS